jgi:RecA/RadA recombinase
VLLSEFSHVNDVEKLQPEAFERLITTYYDTGIADDSLFVYQPLNFKPKMSLARMAKLLVAVMVVVSLLVVGGVALLVRRLM